MLFLRKGSGFIEITGLFGRDLAPPKMASVSASIVKQFFFEKLKPFLKMFGKMVPRW